MLNDAITVGRLFGIRFSISLSWLVIFAVVTFSLGGVYFPGQYPRWPRELHWATGLLASILFFVCVVLHELAHSLVARWAKVPVRSITLFLFGGVSHIGREPPSPGAELAIAIAGPLASIGLGVVAGLGFLATRQVSEPLAALSFWLAGVNLSLGLFNLLPGFPLDGGRVLRALAWFAGEDYHWATGVAARGGQLSALTMIVGGIYLAVGPERGGLANGLWLALIGWFLLSAANSAYRTMRVLAELDGLVVRDVMRPAPPPLSAEAELEQAAPLLEASPGGDPLIVMEGERAIGLLEPAALRDGLAAGLARQRVRTLMTPLPPDLILPPDLPAGQALQALLDHGREVLPVVEQSELLGLVRRDDLLRVVALRRRLRR